LQQDDLELMAIRCAREGDQQAWSQLFDGHFEAVYSFCLRLTQGKQNFAEEATQEAFMIAARKIHRFQPANGTFRSWLFGIAQNRCKKNVTAELRRQARENRYAQQQPGTTFRDSLDPLPVDETLAHLPSHYRSVLEAKYMSGQSVKQIAQANQISEHAAESLLRRAKSKFTQIYTQLKKSRTQP
jgi:RNA polymerase sigma-70 factor (ECF subfamily)